MHQALLNTRHLTLVESATPGQENHTRLHEPEMLLRVLRNRQDHRTRTADQRVTSGNRQRTPLNAHDANVILKKKV